VPTVTDREAFWAIKQGLPSQPLYQDIEMSKNTPMGIYLSTFVLLFGFAAVWHIIWLMVAGLAGAIICVVLRSLDEETEYKIPAAEVERMEHAK